jgi:hypothetical protein
MLLLPRAAYITFADNESIGRAISLSGTSFYSRVLTVRMLLSPSSSLHRLLNCAFSYMACMEPYYFLKRNPIMETGTFDISVVALDILGLILGENIY